MTVSSPYACAGAAPAEIGRRRRRLAVQHAFRDRIGQRLRPLDHREDRQDDQEVREIISGRDLADHHIGLLRRLAAAKAEHEHVDDQDDEEDPEHRPVAARADRRLVEPGQEEEQQDRRRTSPARPTAWPGRMKSDGEGAQDRVERPEIPFGHDVRRRRERVGRHVIDRVAEIIRAGRRPASRAGSARARRTSRPWRCNRDGRAPYPAALFTSTPVGLPEPGMCSAQMWRMITPGDHERQQIMEREEAGQRRLVGRVAAEQPMLDRLADQRESRRTGR